MFPLLVNITHLGPCLFHVFPCVLTPWLWREFRCGAAQVLDITEQGVVATAPSCRAHTPPVGHDSWEPSLASKGLSHHNVVWWHGRWFLQQCVHKLAAHSDTESDILTFRYITTTPTPPISQSTFKTWQHCVSRTFIISNRNKKVLCLVRFGRPHWSWATLCCAQLNTDITD